VSSADGTPLQPLLFSLLVQLSSCFVFAMSGSGGDDLDARARAGSPLSAHRVADGDTLFNISRRYNLSVADLIIANNIKGNNIRKGQLLRVTAAPAKTRNSIRNVSYTVRRGDTLNTIANRFNVDVNDIRRWNRNTNGVTPGQRLKLIGS